MFNWGDLEEAKSLIGGCDSGEMLSRLMRRHTHINIFHYKHSECSSLSELCLNQHSTQLLGDAPNPKAFY